MLLLAYNHNTFAEITPLQHGHECFGSAAQTIPAIFPIRDTLIFQVIGHFRQEAILIVIDKVAHKKIMYRGLLPVEIGLPGLEQTVFTSCM